MEALKHYLNRVLQSSPNLGLNWTPQEQSANPITAFREIAKTFDKLDGGGINPSAQKRFNAAQVVSDQYQESGSHDATRSFAFVTDAQLRASIERDYAELTNKAFPNHAWKSSMILAGSLLEAILCDRLGNPTWNHAALSSSQAPRSETGTPVPFDDWNLEQLINVAQDIGAFTAHVTNIIPPALRDYQNLVHPKQEIRTKHPCSEAEATMSVQVIDGFCDHCEAIQ